MSSGLGDRVQGQWPRSEGRGWGKSGRRGGDDSQEDQPRPNCSERCRSLCRPHSKEVWSCSYSALAVQRDG